jgi:hypothetical protein
MDGELICLGEFLSRTLSLCKSTHFEKFNPSDLSANTMVNKPIPVTCYHKTAVKDVFYPENIELLLKSSGKH